MTDQLIKTMYAVLRLRYSPWNISFAISNSTQEGNFGALFKVIIAPETDAILEYTGWGKTFEEALFMLNDNVVAGNAKENYSD